MEGILAKSSDSMKEILKSACGTKEEHSTMASFSKELSLNVLVTRCELLFNNKYSVFKKKLPCIMHSGGSENGSNDAHVSGETLGVPE